ncbi:MAG: pyridoxal phosphate-dependent decarboxylase family protein [Thermomicrobiales bacterium]
MSKNASSTSDLIDQGLNAIAAWEAQWPPFALDETLRLPEGQAEAVLAELAERLQDNYPFFHPSYAGQMLKPPHPIAAAAYAMAQRINPNNHALDGGPATAALEREVVRDLAAMLGYDPETSLGHLTSSGTIANLEALWVSRSIHPQAAIAFSSEAHYTHKRMCEVIGARGIEIATDSAGRLDVEDLRTKLRSERIGTVVATLGTTSIGAVDPLPELLALQRVFGFRVHVDAAYGGFFALLAGGEDLRPEDAAAYRAIAQTDSVVVDPHKHGLQPYGCGSILFRDASVGRFYQHDSPYTYFTSDELHLGEISLECSRAGAAAAAFWATLQCFPLRADAGLGPILRKTRQAALAWAALISGSDHLRLLTEPSLDILAFSVVPATGKMRASTISALTQQVFARTMIDPADPVYLAKLVVPASRLGPDVLADEATVTVLRSVLMKPEHLREVGRLHERVLQAMSGKD